MQVALSNMIFEACGRDPLLHRSFRDQGFAVPHARAIVRDVAVEYGLRIAPDKLLDMTPFQLDEYVSRS
jgi:hypothetical protein